MTDRDDDIVVLRATIAPDVLRAIVGRHFEGMAKYVVDIQRRVIAFGGAMHADAEERLLEEGGRKADIWEANYYPTIPDAAARRASSLSR